MEPVSYRNHHFSPGSKGSIHGWTLAQSCSYALAISDVLSLDHKTRKHLFISALCHDIGKIGVDDMILRKPGKLQPLEKHQVKRHPEIGAHILDHLPHSEKFLPGVKHHHEKWDGSGYPHGLEKDNIPFFARIIAVVDCFDAMTSKRTYSEPVSHSEALRKIKASRKSFDPEIVDALFLAHDKGLLEISTPIKNILQQILSGN